MMRMGRLNCGPHYVNRSEKKNWIAHSAFLTAWIGTVANKANTLRIEYFFRDGSFFVKK
jgi:hypothetical protein